MNPALVGALSIPFLLALLILRVHVALALGVTGFLGLWVITGKLSTAMGALTTTPYTSIANFAFAVVPLYILMGSWVAQAGFARDAYKAVQTWMGRLPGGLSIATVGANALFGAACGSSSAACAVFTKISLPEMRKHGYHKGLAAATIASAGALAMLIPPSNLMIIYGILTAQSIGALFIAGIIPGLLLALSFSLTVLILIRFRPSLVGAASVTVVKNVGPTWGERLSALRSVWGIVLLIIIVLGGIYGGIFTPTEAGAAGAGAALLLAIFVGRMGLGQLWTSLQDAGRTTAMFFFILITAQVYAKFLTLSGLPEQAIRWTTELNLPPLGIVLASVLVYLLLGTLMDAISMMTITLPIIVPIMTSLGQDPIWFGIIAIVAMELGLITPPFGLDVFVVKAAAEGEVSTEEIFRHAIPFYVAFLLVLAFIIAVPGLVTWLPKRL
ncbi:MAG: TRAP transporter large permease [Chloroflexi bacterium]|nr:TRAP transporter large permease [Chloroflexota bacterium]